MSAGQDTTPVPPPPPPHVIPAVSACATLRLTVRPGCTEADVLELARWAWREAQRQGVRP